MAIKCRRGYNIFQQPRGGNLASDRVQRRLTAILAADVAGYSRLMGFDEADTARTLHEHRAAADPIVASFGGRIVKTTRDGVWAPGTPKGLSRLEEGLRRAGLPE
jgi:adenylate cyclase